MKAYRALLLLPLASLVVLAAPATAQEAPPPWAYPINPPDLKLPPDDGTPRRVPGSSATFTLTQVRDRQFSPVWHPDEHPPQPEVVARGRKPDVPACGFCHRADGPGGPENANLMGLPKAYLMQQAADFKSGARKTSVPKRNIDQKPGMFQAATDAEVEAAAEYFSSLKPRSIVKVVESDDRSEDVHHCQPSGRRVDRRDRAARPAHHRGARGSRAVREPGYACPVHRLRPAWQHQEGTSARRRWGRQDRPVRDLPRPGPERPRADPGIAGRSPSYIVRQLYDFKHGARAGAGSALMKASVEKLTVDDMLELAAYISSLAP